MRSVQGGRNGVMKIVSGDMANVLLKVGCPQKQGQKEKNAKAWKAMTVAVGYVTKTKLWLRSASGRTGGEVDVLVQLF